MAGTPSSPTRFFSTPTPIEDSVGDDGGEEACSANHAADGTVLFDLL